MADQSYEVVFLDWKMPGMDGLALTEAIRQRRGPDELPIVMLTSLGQRLMLPAEQRAGLSAFLSKPIKASELFATAQCVIDSVADKGLFHKNKAARHKSRLSAKIKALSAAA